MDDFNKMTLEKTDFQRKPAQKQFRDSQTGTAVRKAIWLKVGLK